MSILFGHPSGNPNSHHAALAHFEADRLEAFCVPWMPTPGELALLKRVPGLNGCASRLERRCFPLLLNAPRVEGRCSEWWRMARRLAGGSWANERLSYEANDWLMHAMQRECRRPSVTAVHAYEDCSLWQFEEAKRLGKACIYDMPIGYYPAWEQTQAELARRYTNWLPAKGPPSSRYVRPQQKKREMELADLVLAPSIFVKETIRRFHPDKKVALAPYGVDAEMWLPAVNNGTGGEVRFLFVGQLSIRKGVPLLIEAWRLAGLKEARLDLVGSWQLSEAKTKDLPVGVVFHGHASREKLRKHYQSADVFVLPTFFEGRALVLGEALASGLALLTTEASGADDMVDDSCGRLVRSGDLDELVDALRFFVHNRDQLMQMRRAALAKAETCTWEHYRHCVSEAVAPYV